MSSKIIDNQVEIKGRGVVYKIPTNEFTNDELNMINKKAFCPGCIKMPINGYQDKNKKLWCPLSRKVAALQDKYRYL